MLLALDARNGLVSAGFHADPGGWKLIRRIGAVPGRSADEYALLLRLIAVEAGQRTEAVWISCVVPELASRLSQACLAAFGVRPRFVGPGTKTGIKIRTDLPSEVGSDLVCAAAAARELVKGAALIVDFGAALTFSALDAEGSFIGAAIAPGLETSARALAASAAQLYQVGLERPERAIGRNTVQAVRAGLMLGCEGMVSRIVEQMRSELAAADPGAGAAEVLGGGEESGRAIFEACGYTRFVPDLVLDGLALIARRNPA